VLALRLAQLGKRVVLIEKTREPGRRPGESLTPGVLPLLETAGLRAPFEAAGFLQLRSAHIRWAGRSRHADGSGFILDRARLESMLLDAAVKAGVRLIRPARISDRVFDRTWSLEVEGAHTLTARFFADAAGRARLLPGRKIANGPSTFALCAYWSNIDPSRRDTLVEAGPSAWYWGAMLDDGTFSAMVFVDAPDARPEGYRRLIEESQLLAQRLSGGQCTHVSVCDATPFTDAVLVDEASIKVGDAALSIDPLSSQGVETAIGTALHAAAGINTILDRPDDGSLAIEFYRRRVRQSASFHSVAAAAFYREQFEICPTCFWKKRSGSRQATHARRAVVIPGEKVRTAPRARFVRHGVSDGQYIFPEDAVELDGTTVAFIDGVRLRDLLDPAAPPRHRDELISRWTSFMPADQARRIFQWACIGGWIEQAD
jgi:flavin-dependent dehydrogenase